MAGLDRLDPAIHDLLRQISEERRECPAIRAFTPVFDGLCPGMTEFFEHPALQSSFAPDRLTTSAHLAESLLMTAANSSGVPPAGSSPIDAKRARNAGVLIARLIAALSLSRIGL